MMICPYCNADTKSKMKHGILTCRYCHKPFILAESIIAEITLKKQKTVV